MLSQGSDNFHNVVYAVAITHNDTTVPIADPSLSSTGVIDEVQAKAYLTSKSWPIGLQRKLITGLNNIAYRYFLIDDSGSMSIDDGNLYKGSKYVRSTRWIEMTDTMKFHIELARAGRMPTEFRLLNSLPPIVVGSTVDISSNILESYESEDIRYNSLIAILKESPGGSTPLCRHINEITKKIKAMNPMLVSTSQRVSVVIFTDGESSDGDLNDALKPLKSLNVDILIRLCTDNRTTIDYWNKIDTDLELKIDILDDLKKECYETMKSNPWLNYCQELQRFRESGVFLQEFDYIDEGKMSVEQMKKFISIIIDKPDLTHPDTDFNEFMREVKDGVRALPDIYNPKYSRMIKIINTKRLKSMYKPGLTCSIM